MNHKHYNHTEVSLFIDMLGGRDMTPSFKTSIGFLTDKIFDRKLMHFCAANEKLFLSQVVGVEFG